MRTNWNHVLDWLREIIVVMRDGTELTMSRGYRDRLGQLLNAFK